MKFNKSLFFAALLTFVTAGTARAQTPTFTPTPDPTPLPRIPVACTLDWMPVAGGALKPFKTPHTCTIGVTFSNGTGGSTERYTSCVVPAGQTSCQPPVLIPPYGWKPVSAWVSPAILTDNERAVAGCIPAKGFPSAMVVTDRNNSAVVRGISAIHRHVCAW